MKTKTKTKLQKDLAVVNKSHLKIHGKTFHASLTDDIRNHVDSSTIRKGVVNIKGWVFHEIDNVKDIKLKVNGLVDNIKCTIKRTQRDDVNAFYAPFKLGKELIGYEISANVKPNITIGTTVILECNTNKDEKFKTFEACVLTPALSVNDIPPGLTVIDNFYNNPDAVRELALQQEFAPSQYHKGKRTTFKYCVEGTRKKIEKLLGLKITDWDNQPHNTVFQYCTPADPLVYHYDGQTHAAVVFLTPDAPVETGTSFLRHKTQTWLDREPTIGNNGLTTEQEVQDAKNNLIGSSHDDFLDGTKWEEIDRIGNKFNRFAMWDAKTIHAATEYFGTSKETGRLFHMFFFNAK